MAAKFGVYLTFEELRGSPCSIEEFREELSRYQLSGVLYLCSALNCLLRTFDNLDGEAHERFICDSFPPRSQQIIRNICERSGSKRFLFHRQQLLFVAKQALFYCSDEGKDPLSAYWGGFGLVLLMANDHLHFPHPLGTKNDQELMSMVASFIPIHEASGRMKEILYSSARSVLMLTDIGQQLTTRKEFVDIPRLFEECTGLALSDYHALCYGVLSLYLTMDYTKFKTDPSKFSFLQDKCFESSPYSRDTICRFIKLTSKTPAEIRDAFRTRDVGTNDFTAFRDSPLINHKGTFYPIDVNFLSEKFETGPFWIVNAFLKKPVDRQQLHTYWGLVFEEYVCWMLSEAIDPSLNRFVPRPRFRKNGEEVCDALILCGTDAVFLELKGTTLTAASKYSQDIQALRSELERKLLGVNDGVGQLARSLKDVFESADEPIIGVDFTGVKRVYPVLVTRDSISECIGMNLLATRRFKEYIGRRKFKGRIVTPLHLMSVSDLERVAAYLQVSYFPRILDARYRQDRNLVSTWSATENDEMQRVGFRRNSQLERSFQKIMNNVSDRLFPGERSRREISPD